MEQPPQTADPTPEETKGFIDRLNSEGLVTPEKRQGWDLVAAYSLLDKMMENGIPLDEKAIKNFQGLITKNIPHLKSTQRGQYSYSKKEIRGVKWECKPFAHPDTIDSRMKRLAQYLENYMKFKPENPTQIHKVIDHAAEVMVDFIDIHPFSDGNGRTSRLLADGILMSGGLYPMPQWLNQNIDDSSKRRQNFAMMMEHACRGYFPLLLKFMVGQQRKKVENELDAIEHITQARIETKDSGYWLERVVEYETLTDYELILSNEIINNPPSALPLKNTTSS